MCFPIINFIMGVYLPIESYLNNFIQGKSYIDITIVTIDIVKVIHNINSQEYVRDNNIIPKQDNIIILKQDNSLTIAIILAITLAIELLYQVFNPLVRISFISFFSLLEHTSLFKKPLFFFRLLFLVYHHHLSIRLLLLECFISSIIDIKDLQPFHPLRYLRSNHHHVQIASLIRHSRMGLYYLLRSFLRRNNLDNFQISYVATFINYFLIYSIFYRFFYSLLAIQFILVKSI